MCNRAALYVACIVVVLMIVAYIRALSKTRQHGASSMIRMSTPDEESIPSAQIFPTVAIVELKSPVKPPGTNASIFQHPQTGESHILMKHGLFSLLQLSSAWLRIKGLAQHLWHGKTKQYVYSLPRPPVMASQAFSLGRGRRFAPRHLWCDTRFFMWKGVPWLTGAAIRLIPCRTRIFMAQYDATAAAVVESTVTTLKSDRKLSLQRHERNWMPLPVDQFDWLPMIYSLSPLRILRFQPGHPYLEQATHAPLIYSEETLSRALTGFRGGTAFIPLPGQTQTYLTIVHRVYKPRYYVHHWLTLCIRTGTICWSDAFHIMPSSASHAKYYVEFPCGLIFDAREQQLLLTMGVQDHTAYLVKINPQMVLQSVNQHALCLPALATVFRN